MGSERATSVEKKSAVKTEFDYFTGSCRVCMARNTDMQPLFEAEGCELTEKIEFCTGIRFSNVDGFSTHICNACIQNLTIAHQFKTSCVKADESFRKVVTNVKTEEPDDIINIYEDDFQYVDDDDVKDVLKKVLDLNEVEIKQVKKEEESIELVEKPKKKRKYTKRRPTEPKTYNTRKPAERKSYAKIKPDKQRKTYTKRKPAKQHKPKEAKKNKKLPECEKCAITFESKPELEEHRKTVHKDNTLYMCDVCGKMFVHNSSLYSHMAAHRPPQFACDKCDYTTVNKFDLVKHLRIHLGIKSYQCEFCTNAYFNSSNLSHHIRSFHKQERRYTCHLCNKTFFDRTKLNRHVDSHNEIKRFECSICKCMFTRRCYWKKHVTQRHGVAVPPVRPGRRRGQLPLEP